MKIALGRKSLVKFGIGTLVFLILVLVGFFIFKFVFFTSAAIDTTNTAVVTATAPGRWTRNDTNEWFNFTIMLTNGTVNVVNITIPNSTAARANFTIDNATNIPAINATGTWAVSYPENYSTGSSPRIIQFKAAVGDAFINLTRVDIYATANITDATDNSTQIWNITVGYNETGKGYNSTLLYTFVDSQAPRTELVQPLNATFINGDSSSLFNVTVNELNLNTSNATLNWRLCTNWPTACGAWQAASLTCTLTGTEKYVCQKTDQDLTISPDGNNISYYYNFSDNVNYYTSNGTASDSLVATVDRTTPLWSSNDTAVASGSEYTSGKNFGFEITWRDGGSGINNVTLEANFSGTKTNYTNVSTPAIQNSGSIYYINFTQEQMQGAYAYTYRWFANDTVTPLGDQHTNSSDEWSYVIAKAPTALDIWLNGTAGNNATIAYPSPANATAKLNVTGLYFWIRRNDTVIINSTGTIFNTTGLANATYNFTAVFPGNENYTANRTQLNRFLHVEKANSTSHMVFVIDGSSIYSQSRQYPNITTINGSQTLTNGYSDVNFTLLRNGTVIGETVVDAHANESVRLGAEKYNYTYNTTGGANWTFGRISIILSVSRASVMMNLSLNGTQANRTYLLPEAINATAWKNSTHTDSTYNLTLYRNGALVDTTTTADSVYQNASVSAGDYNYTAVFFSANYTNTSITTNRFVVMGNVPTPDNATASPADSTGYSPGKSYILNISWDDNNNVSTVFFEWNGTSNDTATIASFLATGGNYSFTKTDLPVGNYTYSWFANDTNDYWNVSRTYTYNVTRNVTIANFVGLGLNGTESNKTYVYPQAINASAWINFTNYIETGNLSLWRDDTIVQSTDTSTSQLLVTEDIVLANQSYNYTATFTSTNYTSNGSISTNRFAIVQKGVSNVTMWIGEQGSEAAANATLQRGDTLNITMTVNMTYDVTINIDANITGWSNQSTTGTSLENTTSTSTFTVANFYNVTCYFSGDENFTADSKVFYLNITPDITAPSIFIFDDSLGTYDIDNTSAKKESAVFSVNLSVSDAGVGITNGEACNVTIGGIEAGSSTYSGNWCNVTVTVPSGPSDGPNALNITINDTNKNTGVNDTYQILVDNTPPLFTIMPANGTYNKSGSFALTWIRGSVFDNLQMGTGNVTINSTYFNSTPEGLPASFTGENNTGFAFRNYTTLADVAGGYIAVEINYSDNATNIGNATVYFYVDNIGPTSIFGNTTGILPRNTSQIVQVTVLDNLMTNGSITLHYYRDGFDTTWQETPMTGTPGTDTVYNATINTDVVNMGATVKYYVTGIDNATNVLSSTNGTAESPLGNFTIEITGSPGDGSSGGLSDGGLIQQPEEERDESKTFIVIVAGGTGYFSITDSDTFKVMEINITVVNRSNDVKITIREGSHPTGAPLPVDEDIGSVYKYLEITKGNITNANISLVKIKFKVSKLWLNNESMSSESITLYRYSAGSWTRLDTTKVDEDSDYYYYVAETNALSTFAIAGETIIQKIACPYECCVGDAEYTDKACSEDYECELHTCELTVECSTCSSPSAWSDCVDWKRARTNYRCSSETNYQCEAYTETENCVPPLVLMIPFEVIMAIVVLLAVVVVVVFVLKKRKKKPVVVIKI